MHAIFSRCLSQRMQTHQRVPVTISIGAFDRERRRISSSDLSVRVSRYRAWIRDAKERSPGAVAGQYSGKDRCQRHTSGGHSRNHSAGVLFAVAVLSTAPCHDSCSRCFRDRTANISKATAPRAWTIYDPFYGVQQRSLRLPDRSGNLGNQSDQTACTL